jgi:2,3-dihydroxyphenylpropionate 1,2-dioxygenase
MLADESKSVEEWGMLADWDARFLHILCGGDLALFDTWDPDEVVKDAEIGSMEVLSWIAAAQAMQTATGCSPKPIFNECVREVGVGFGIAEAGPASLN